MHEDQSEPDTFWFKCPRGHVDEHPEPPEGAAPLLCWATVVRGHDGGHGIYTDACREEMRRVGPTVAEWRACNEALRIEQVEHTAKHARLEGMLAEADRALAECGRQLDAAQHRIGDLQGDVNVHLDATRKASEERDDLQAQLDLAATAVLLNRDAAAREARTRRERDDLQAQLDDVLRRQRFAEGMRRAAELYTDDEEEPNRADLAAELARRLAQMERDRVAAEAHAEEWRVKAGTEQAGRLAAERKASRGHGFTLVRDVNGQTEEALRVAKAAAIDARQEERNARQEVTHWRMVALWAAERDALTDLPQASFQQRSEVLSDRYEAEMEAASR